MTGRDLIIYILENGLEDEPVFQNDTFIGFVTAEEAAVFMDVGTATIYAWIQQGQLESIKVRGKYYIPAKCMFD